MDNIPLLINGKTDRQTLLKMYENSSFQDNNNNEKIDCNYTDVPESLLEQAKVLFPTVASVIGKSSRSIVNINSNFYELGGNSLNSIYTVTKLQDQGYQVGITDFLTAKNMKDILVKMTICSKNQESNDTSEKPKFFIEPFQHSHKAEVSR